jgi:dTDP-4-amino-4,6-dideoxygalactose transaminase
LKLGINTGLHYPLPIHLQKAYEKLGYKHGAFPVAELRAAQMISLPMFAELSSEQINYVCNTLVSTFDKD